MLLKFIVDHELDMLKQDKHTLQTVASFEPIRPALHASWWVRSDTAVTCPLRGRYAE